MSYLLTVLTMSRKKFKKWKMNMIRFRHMKRPTKEMTKGETIKSQEKEVFNILIVNSIEGGIVKREKQKKLRLVFRSWAKRS